VPEDEDPLSSVGGTHILGADAEDLHGVATPSHLGCHNVQAPPSQSTDILPHGDSGSDCVDDIEAPPEQPGSLSVESVSGRVGLADVLARKAAADEIDPRDSSSGNCGWDCLDMG
jgi:hypothetical protein